MCLGTDTVADGQEHALGWVSTTTITTRQNEFRIRGRKGSKAWSDWSAPFEAALAGQLLFGAASLSSDLDTLIQLTITHGDTQFTDGAVDFQVLLFRILKATNQHQLWMGGSTNAWETWGNALSETEARSHSIWFISNGYRHVMNVHGATYGNYGAIHDIQFIEANDDYAAAGSYQASTEAANDNSCLLYTSPSPRDRTRSRMPSSA